MALNPGKNVGRLSIRVIPDASKFRDDIKVMIDRVERTMQVKLKVDANLREAELAIRKFRSEQDAKAISLRVSADTLLAKAEMLALARDRLTTLRVRVNEGSLKKVQTALGAISGVRLSTNILKDFNESLSHLDENLPAISRLALGLANVASGALSGTAGIVTVGGDLLKIANLGFVLPAMFGAIATGVTTLVLALKDAKTELAVLGPAMKGLQDSISTNFWAKAKAPIIEFVQTLLPSLQRGFGNTATALGGQAAAIAAAFQKTLGGGVLDKMFDKLTESIDIVSGGAGSFAGALTTIGTIGSAYLPQLAKWIVGLGDSFNSWVQASAASGALDAFIKDGIEQVKALGRAVSGIAGIFSAINSAAEAAGGTGLTHFADAVQGAAKIMQSADVQAALTTVLKGADAGLSSIGGGISAFGQALVTLAPTISDVLASAGDSIGTLITAISGAITAPEFQKGLTDLFNGINDGINAIAPALPALAGLFGSLGSALGTLAANVGPLLAVLKETFAPILQGLIDALTPLIPMISGALTGALEKINPLFRELGNFIKDQPGVFQGIALAILGIAGAMKAISFVTMLAGLAKTAAAWVAQTAAMVASKAETLAITALYAKDLVVSLAKGAAGLVAQAAAWVANTAATIASKVALVAGAVATAAATAAQWLLNVALSANPIGIIIVAIAALVAGLIWFFTQTELGKEVFANVVSFITTVVTNLGSFFSTVWTAIVDYVTVAIGLVLSVLVAVGTTITDIWNTVWGAISSFFTGIWDGIVAFITAYLTTVFTIITTVGQTISDVWNTVWGAISSFFTGIWDGIVAFITLYLETVFTIITTVGQTISDVWNAVWGAISSFFVGIWDGIVAFINAYLEAVFLVITTVGQTISDVWNTVWGAISSFFSGIWEGIVGFVTTYITTVLGIIQAVGATISGIWTGIWNGITGAVSGAWKSITDIVGKIVDGIGSMLTDIGTNVGKVPGIIGDAFKNAGTWLVDSGKKIIQGLIDGITGMVKNVTKAVGDIMGKIADFFPHSPAKKGPFSGRGWTPYSGEALAKGFASGISNGTSSVRNAALAMMSSASGVARVDVGDATTTIANRQGAATTSGTTVTVLGNVGYDPKGIADEIDKKKRQANMLAGLRTAVA